MTFSCDIVVLGAGALGLGVAAELRARGRDVCVVDPGGTNASSVAAGMIAPVSEALTDESARPHFDLLLAASELWPAFAAEIGLSLDGKGAVLLGDEVDPLLLRHIFYFLCQGHRGRRCYCSVGVGGVLFVLLEPGIREGL